MAAVAAMAAILRRLRSWPMPERGVRAQASDNVIKEIRMGLIDWTRRMFGGSVEKSADYSMLLRSLGGSRSATGLAINQMTAISISTVYACASIRSKDVSRCSPRLMREDSARSEKPVTNHPVAKLFRRPNNWQTWTEFCRQMHCAFLLRGNAFAVILRDGRGNPTALIPINPDQVILYEAQDGSIFYTVTRTGVFLQAILRGEPAMIPEDDIFHLRDLGFNMLMGLSRISIARESFGVAAALEQQAARFMGQGARPAGVLQTDKVLSADAAERLRVQWTQMREGLQNVGRTAILEEGLKWTPMQLSSVDLEFMAQREYSVSDIARWFDMPLYKLGVKGEMSRLKVDDSDQAYVNTTIMPDLDCWEQKFIQKFDLDKENLVADFDERRLLRAAEATRINTQRLKIMSGISTPNECRAENGDPPLPNGDDLLLPVNLAAAGSDVTGTAPDGAGRPEGGNLPDPGAANEDKPDKPNKMVEDLMAAQADERQAHRGVVQEMAEIAKENAAAFKAFAERPQPEPAPTYVNIEQQPTNVNVTTPEIKMPDINMPAPVVNVDLNMPAALGEKTVVTKHTADGRIAEFIKTPIVDE